MGYVVPKPRWGWNVPPNDDSKSMTVIGSLPCCATQIPERWAMDRAMVWSTPYGFIKHGWKTHHLFVIILYYIYIRYVFFHHFHLHRGFFKFSSKATGATLQDPVQVEDWKLKLGCSPIPFGSIWWNWVEVGTSPYITHCKRYKSWMFMEKPSINISDIGKLLFTQYHIIHC